MATKEHIKIIVSAIIVIVLVSMGIYAFIFRNELSQKIQEIGKKNEEPSAKVDRIIIPPSPVKEMPDMKKEELPKKEIIPDVMAPANAKKASDVETKKNHEEIIHKKKDMAYDENLLPASDKKNPSDSQILSGDRRASEKSKKPKSGKKKKSKVQKKNLKAKNLEKRVARLEKKLGVSRKNGKLNLEKRVRRLEKISEKKGKMKKSKSKKKKKM